VRIETALTTFEPLPVVGELDQFLSEIRLLRFRAAPLP
jgi:hypothetical protein